MIIIFVLEHWEVDVPLKSIEDPEHFKAVKAFCETHKQAYKWVKLYILEHIELPDGSERKVLRRKEPSKPNGGQIEVSCDTVCDAINDWHHKRGHLGQERTRDPFHSIFTGSDGNGIHSIPRAALESRIPWQERHFALDK